MHPSRRVVSSSKDLLSGKSGLRQVRDTRRSGGNGASTRSSLSTGARPWNWQTRLRRFTTHEQRADGCTSCSREAAHQIPLSTTSEFGRPAWAAREDCEYTGRMSTLSFDQTMSGKELAAAIQHVAPVHSSVNTVEIPPQSNCSVTKTTHLVMLYPYGAHIVANIGRWGIPVSGTPKQAMMFATEQHRPARACFPIAVPISRMAGAPSSPGAVTFLRGWAESPSDPSLTGCIMLGTTEREIITPVNAEEAIEWMRHRRGLDHMY